MGSTPFHTRIAIPDGSHDRLATMLNVRLADALDLYAQTKHAHWNVKGPHFQQLHELFDQLAKTIAGHADELAERATALGAVAEGTLRRAAEASTLPEMGSEVLGHTFVAALADRYGQYANSLRADALECGDLGDLVTQDLLTQLCGEADKALYFLEAHLVVEETTGKRASAPSTRTRGERPHALRKA